MVYEKRIVLFSLFVMNLVDQPAPEVRIAQGILSGKVSDDGSFFEYLGIPYATTNSSTRFKAPLPPPSWEGVYKAINENHNCPQSASIFGVFGMEDCLKINVYVPAIVNKPLPVMVFIHGGAFAVGSGGKIIYGPEFIVKHDVILITFNYRLGALGFLCLGIKEAPGNAGIKDQIAALKWIKNNIKQFGGDPDNVTIFGQSAGAASVSILLASNVTDDLFHKAIIQSGTSTASWSINRHPVWVASLIAKHLGYITEDPYEIYKIFSKLPYKVLVKARPRKNLGMYFDTQLLNYPCVERSIEGEQAVITDYPYNLFKSYSKKKIPVIYGTTSQEGVFLLPEDTKDYLAQRDSQYIFASDLEFSSEEEAASLSKTTKAFYFGDNKISFEVNNIISDVNTQQYFEIPSILESQAIVNSTEVDVFNYYFNYAGDRNFYSKILALLGYKFEGATHSDELLYLFKGKVWPFSIHLRDQKVIDWLTKLWTNFAKYGNPTPNKEDFPLRWEPSKKDKPVFLYIEDEPKMGPLPNPESYHMWKEIYEKYRKKNKPNDFKT